MLFLHVAPINYLNDNLTLGQSHGRTIVDSDNSIIVNSPECYPQQQNSILKNRIQQQNPFINNAPFLQTNNNNQLPTIGNYTGCPQNQVRFTDYNTCQNLPYCQYNNGVLIPQQHNIPGGVTYTFDPTVTQYGFRNFR